MSIHITGLFSDTEITDAPAWTETVSVDVAALRAEIAALRRVVLAWDSWVCDGQPQDGKTKRAIHAARRELDKVSVPRRGK